jgi:hypothetical protein
LQHARDLFIGQYRGLKEVSHGGAWIGYRAEWDRYPTVHTGYDFARRFTPVVPSAAQLQGAAGAY